MGNLNYNNLFFNSVAIILALAIFAHLICWWIFLQAILSILYYWILKIMFPKESQYIKNYISIRELSEYININDQMKFLNTLIINIVMYLIAVGYVFLWIMSLLSSNDEVIKVIIDFSKKYSVVSFGNTVGLFSLLIAVYTVTYSQQNKIYDKALEESYDKTYSSKD